MLHSLVAVLVALAAASAPHGASAAPAVQAGIVVDAQCVAHLPEAGGTDYWSAVAACGPCLDAGCAFSLNSLLCQPAAGVAGDALMLVGASSVCPTPPQCLAATCDGCLSLGPDCAWCGREATCLPSSQAFSGNVACTAVQYTAPCVPADERAWRAVCARARAWWQ